MTRIDDLISIETYSAEPVRFKGFTLTPFSQAVQINLPGLAGGLVWNRPYSVLVTDREGNEQVLPIHDITRWLVWGLIGLTGFTAILLWMFGKRRKET